MGCKMQYRKKPIVVDAFQWTGDEMQKEDPIWAVDAIKNGDIWFCVDPFGNGGVTHMAIRTLEGVMEARFDDYIIKGIKGEIYPCKPDIFEATYEAVLPLKDII